MILSVSSICSVVSNENCVGSQRLRRASGLRGSMGPRPSISCAPRWSATRSLAFYPVGRGGRKVREAPSDGGGRADLLGVALLVEEAKAFHQEEHRIGVHGPGLAA